MRMVSRLIASQLRLIPVEGSSPSASAAGVWQNQKLHPAFNRNYVGAIPTAPTFMSL